VIQQGELSWRSIGRDGLVAQAEGLEIWINRSRYEALALPDPQASAEVLWSTEEATPAGAIAAQSAAPLLTSPR
jgi:neopullulanase